MRTRLLSDRAVSLIIILLGLTAILFVSFYYPPGGLRRVESASLVGGNILSSDAEQKDAGLPARLTIPSIAINAPFEFVGVNTVGAIDAPREHTNVAWFNQGSLPGENGTAIIVGHYGWGNKKASVFDNLHKLRKGDKLYIEDDRGIMTSFVVRESKSYDKDDDASEVFRQLAEAICSLKCNRTLHDEFRLIWRGFSLF